MQNVIRVLLSLLCALAVTLTPAGADANEQLIDAVRSCDSAETKRLVADGADVNMKIRSDGEGNLLHLAAQTCNSSEVIIALTEAGVDLNAVFKTKEGVHLHEGNTPLHIALIYGNLEAVIAFIQAGADVNAKNKDKHNTPLHIVAGPGGNADVAIALIKAGAYINATNNEGYTPLELAKGYKNWGVAQVLENPPPVKQH